MCIRDSLQPDHAQQYQQAESLLIQQTELSLEQALSILN